jgi:HIV Tat-specific factor 1
MSICTSKFIQFHFLSQILLISFQPESVKLCIDMLDEMDLRSSKIHVERAKFEAKGAFNPDLKRKRKKIDKKKKQTQLGNLLNWDERPEVVRHEYEKIIVMKNMFDLQQFKV